MYRHSSAARHDDVPAASAPRESLAAELRDVGGIDLASLRLALRQHLDELRRRGVTEGVLRPIEAELRGFEDTVDELVRGQQRP